MEPEPIRIPITDVFDLHTVPPRDVKAVVEEYLMRPIAWASKLCASFTGGASACSGKSCARARADRFCCEFSATLRPRPAAGVQHSVILEGEYDTRF